MTHPVGHTIADQRPHYHSSRLPAHDAEAQAGPIVDQLDLLHVAPLILQQRRAEVCLRKSSVRCSETEPVFPL